MTNEQSIGEMDPARLLDGIARGTSGSRPSQQQRGLALPEQNGLEKKERARRAVQQRQERSFWLELGKQPNYKPLDRNKRTPMASVTGIQKADEILWTVEALVNRNDRMQSYLHDHFGNDKNFEVTSVVKPHEHTEFRKMDVAPRGTTTWEELAAAAVHAGFWVHAEGVTLGGKFWPLSDDAKGSHLDLYLVNPQIGDFPPPKGVRGALNSQQRS
jgi:hypothetical protein